MMRGEPTCAAVIPLPAPHTAHLGTKDTRANFLTLNTLCNHLMGKFPPRFYKQTTGNNEVMRNVKKRRRATFCTSKYAIQKIWEQLGVV